MSVRQRPDLWYLCRRDNKFDGKQGQKNLAGFVSISPHKKGDPKQPIASVSKVLHSISFFLFSQGVIVLNGPKPFLTDARNGKKSAANYITKQCIAKPCETDFAWQFKENSNDEHRCFPSPIKKSVPFLHLNTLYNTAKEIIQENSQYAIL